MTVRAPLAALLSVLVLAGCGADAAKVDRTAAPAPGCATRAAWQKLANRVHAVVFCPTWMPAPLDAQIGGTYANGADRRPDGSYLVSFLWHESDGSGEAHVNFRGYPGRTTIPTCLQRSGDANLKEPCFRDGHPVEAIGPFRARLYTPNLDADQWHVLYAWRYRGSLYTASMHVADPYPFDRALTAIRHVVRSLVPLKPR